MGLYYSLFVISFLLCFFDFVDIKGVKNAVYFIFCSFVVLVVSLRGVGVDNDSRNYLLMFTNYGNSSVSQIMKGGFGYVEKGYVFLNHYVYKFGGSFQTLLFLVSILTGYLNFRYYKRKSKYIFLTLLFHLSFFFLYRDFTQIRYALACALIFWCVEHYLQQSYKWSIFIFLLAVSMHNAAMIIIPALLFVRYIDNKYIYILLPIPCIILGVSFNILNYFLGSGLATDHMSIYQNEQSGGSMSISIIGYVLVLLYLIINYKGFRTIFEKESYFYWKIVALSVSFNFLTINISIFQRFSFILFQFAVILLPFMAEDLRLNFKRKDSFIMLYFLFSLLLLFYGLRMIDVNLVRPYRTF